jgi:hypothetical protein
MLPPSPKVVANSLDNGWIQRQGAGGELAYRITEKGLAAKKAPIRILKIRRLIWLRRANDWTTIRGRRWTAAEKNQLQEMLAAGMTAPRIGRKLDRTVHAIYARLQCIYRSRRATGPARAAAP